MIKVYSIAALLLELVPVAVSRSARRRGAGSGGPRLVLGPVGPVAGASSAIQPGLRYRGLGTGRLAVVAAPQASSKDSVRGARAEATGPSPSSAVQAQRNGRVTGFSGAEPAAIKGTARPTARVSTFDHLMRR